MALKEQDIVFTTTDEAGNTVIQFPITRVENVEDAVRTVNKKKPDSNGDIQIDVDMSHLATKDELTKGLANKRDHTIQIANADLNTLLEDKTWACSGTLKNTPIACTFCIVQAYDTGAPVSGNIVQVCYVPNQTDNTVRTFWRNCNNGVTFGKWSESGAVKTVNSITPDESGNIDVPNATTSKFGLVRLAAEEDVLKESPQTAVCTQLIYEINEFRRKSTAYQVGEKVDCAFQYERFLECTKAGTTSADMFDTRNVTHGQVIKDGTVEWTVRTHVRSINGSVAGADGNVLVDVGAKTVNGKGPDGSGNVKVDVGVKTVNGTGPDSLGNITPEQTGCLPLSGGTMTGEIYLGSPNVGKVYSRADNDYRFIALAADNQSGTGGRFEAFGLDSPLDKGSFNCRAISSDGTIYDLHGFPNGLLKWTDRIVGVNEKTIVVMTGSGRKVTLPNGGSWSGLIYETTHDTDYGGPRGVFYTAGGTVITLASSSDHWGAIFFRVQ